MKNFFFAFFFFLVCLKPAFASDFQKLFDKVYHEMAGSSVFTEVDVLGTENEVLSVEITAPQDGELIPASADVIVQGTAAGSDLKEVILWLHDGTSWTKMATITTFPFSENIGTLASGAYKIKATAFANDGSKTSQTINVNVYTASNDNSSDFQKLFNKLHLSYSLGINNFSDSTGKYAGICYEERATGFEELLEMAIGISNPSNPNFENQDIINHILKTLDDYYKAHTERGKGYLNNYTRQYTVGPLCVLMKKYMSDTLREKIYKIDFKRTPNSVGTNLIHGAHILMVGSFLVDDEEAFNEGLDSLKSCIPISKFVGHELPFQNGGEPGWYTGAGLKPDGSWWHHGHQLYTGRYGETAARELAFWGNKLDGLEYAYTEEEIRTLSFYILDHVQWNIYKGYKDYTGEGRYPQSRYRISRHVQMCNNMMVLDKERADEYKAFLQHLENPPYTNISGNRHFWVSDYSVHRRENFHVGIKVASDRTHIQEGNKNENNHGYYLSQGGMVIEVHGDETNEIFSDNQWNWSRIPGTTTRQLSIDNIPIPGTNTGATEFAGGVSDDQNGVTGFDMDWHGTKAKKSWFMFENLIVALGCDIQSDASEEINTTINQAWRKGEVTMGYEANSQTYDKEAKIISKPTWAFHNNVGYIFSSGEEVVLNASDALFSLIVNHGAKPHSATYQYILAPDVEVNDMEELAENNPIVAVQNDTNCQAVIDTQLNITGIVFYHPGALELPSGLKISVDKRCALMLKISDEAMDSLAVASPASDTSIVKVTLQQADSVINYEIQLPKAEMAGKSVIEQINVPETQSTPDTTTSIKNTKLNDQVSISPNPVNNYLAIRGISNNSELEIYSMTGNLVKHQYITNGTINVSDLNRGIFFMKIKRNGEIVTAQKIVKQ